MQQRRPGAPAARPMAREVTALRGAAVGEAIAWIAVFLLEVMMAAPGCAPQQQADSAPGTRASVQTAVEALAASEADPRCVAPSLAAGDRHTCIVRGDGSVACWGSNAGGQLGLATISGTVMTPTVVPGLSRAVAVAAGAAHTCALGDDGAVRCWGTNGAGQLGRARSGRYPTPAVVDGLGPAVAITAGAQHTCALTADGSVWCWGSNASGQLGDGTTTVRRAPVRALTVSRATAVVAGTSHTCAIVAGGEAYCWGANASGQVGNGVRSPRVTGPTLVNGSGHWQSLAAGQAHTCGIHADAGRTVECWGSNGAGQLGDVQRVAVRVGPGPVHLAIGTLGDAVQIAAAANTTCAVLGDGSERCWGANNQAQIGDGSVTLRRVATAVSATTPLAGHFLLTARATSHTCAVTLDGEVHCWGTNAYGQLGDGTKTRRLVPVRVAGQGARTFGPFVDEAAPAASDRSGASSLAAGAAGSLWVAGLAREGSASAWYVDRSRDLGATWSRLPSYSHAPGGEMRSPHLAVDPIGALFLAGGGDDDDGVSHWLVRSSMDGGDTWTTSDDFVLREGLPAAANAVWAGAGGWTYAAGFATDAFGLRRWLVRGSHLGSNTSWWTEDDFLPADAMSGEALQAVDVSGVGVFVVGDVETSAGARLLVRRLAAYSTGPWVTVDDYQLDGDDTRGVALAADRGGLIYTAGAARSPLGQRWLVRRSRDAGATWQLVDDFQLEAGQDAEPAAIQVDAAGSVYVAGHARRAGETIGILRVSLDHGATWRVADQVPGAAFTGVAQDSSYGVHVAGGAGSAPLLRGRACGQLRPVCGNQVVESGESCDGSCPTRCEDDGLLCTTEALVGSSATCNAACTRTPITTCASGDGCCPAGCTMGHDSDCAVQVVCSGTSCSVALPASDRHEAQASALWDPCQGAGFYWEADGSFDSRWEADGRLVQDSACIGGIAGRAGCIGGAGRTLTWTGPWAGAADGPVVVGIWTGEGSASPTLSSLSASCRPTVTEITPDTLIPGRTSTEITIHGSHFSPGSQYLLRTSSGSWVPGPLPATFDSPSQLRAAVGDAAPGSVLELLVLNPGWTSFRQQQSVPALVRYWPGWLSVPLADAAGVPVAGAHVVAVQPSVTDGGISDRSPASSGAASSSGYGWHVVAYPEGYHGSSILLWLQGSGDQPFSAHAARPGLPSARFLAEAVARGYLVLQIAHVNDGTIDGDCRAWCELEYGSASDACLLGCFGRARQEVVEGFGGDDIEFTVLGSRGQGMGVRPADGVLNRIQRLVEFIQHNPVAFDGLTLPPALAGTTVDYSAIRLGGHSQGGGHAAFIAQGRRVGHVCYLASVVDHVTRPSGLVVPAPWTAGVFSTPVDDMRALHHANDPNADGIDANLTAIGLDGAHTRTIQDGCGTATSDCDPHAAVLRDPAYALDRRRACLDP